MKSDRVIAAFVCSLGGVVFGYDLGALSAVSLRLRSEFALGPSAFGLTMSASLWGTVFGSLLAGYFADRWGRRALVASCAVVYIMAAAGLALCGPFDWACLLVLRIICGITIGGFTVGCPLYLAEISPPERRGAFVAWFQVQVGIGVILGFATGAVFAHILSTSLYCRGCFGAGMVPSLLMLCLMGHMPGETTWSDHRTKARGRDIAERPSISTLDEASARLLPNNSSADLFRRAHLKPLLLATSIALFNQLSGVNILLLYLIGVLSNTGVDFSRSHTYAVLISVLNMLTTILGMALIDKAGRKALLITGSAGMALCLFILSGNLHAMTPLNCVLLLVAYNACFAFSQGTVVWVYLSELFPLEVRAKGQSYGSSVLWGANAVLVFLYPTLQAFGPESLFRFFGAAMLLQIAVVFFLYPETTGMRLEQRI
jgi:sugar porter (SP) family MFS transporter